MAASVKKFLSVIQRSRFRLEHNIEYLFEAKPALPVDRVESSSPVHYLPLDIVGLTLLLQLPNMGTEGCAGLTFTVLKVMVVFVPPSLKCASCEACVVFRSICGGNTGNIDNIVFLTFWGGEGAVGGSPPAVATLGWLCTLLFQQLCVVLAD